MPASRSASRDIKRARPARRWPLVLLGLIVLSGAIVFALPASFAARFMPAQVKAEDFSGRLLHGAAGRIRINSRDSGAIEWQVHPLALLRLAIVADIHWVKLGFLIDGTAELTTGGFAAHDITGGGPIDDLRDLGFAQGWKGTAKLAFTRIKGNFQKLEAAVGKIDVANISSASVAAGSDLGSYELQLGPQSIAEDGSMSAILNDTGGPVEAQAQIRFSPATRTGMLSGTLKERTEASRALRNQLNNLSQLRPRDASGRFPVELEFTF
ncbi:MAG: type II secretion system protein N [Steroidobacteraceae bacterium]